AVGFQSRDLTRPQAVILGWLLRADAPDAALAVDRVRLVHPVAQVDRTVWSDRDGHRPKVVAAAHDRLRLGPERCPIWLRPEALDNVVAPRRREQAAAVLGRQSHGFIGDDATGCLAGAGHHAEGAGQLAVPALEGVRTLAAITEAIAVVAA